MEQMRKEVVEMRILYHAIDRVAAAAAHTDHLDAGSAHTLFVILNAHLHDFFPHLFHLGSALLMDASHEFFKSFLKTRSGTLRETRCSALRYSSSFAGYTESCQ